MTTRKARSKILKKRKKKDPRRRLSFFKWTMVFVFICILLRRAELAGIYIYLSGNLPKINTLEDYQPATVSHVFSDDGRKIGEFYNERRIVIPLSEMPGHLINAFVAAEDSRFREHPGVDIQSIFRAFIKNFQAGTITQGGSTITQQVTKSFLLTPERTYERKLKEAILAYRIEKNSPKIRFFIYI